MNETFINKLKKEVEEHPILNTNEWLNSKDLTFEDLILWLKQEYFVSVAFVNWFLWTTTNTNNITAKIVLVQNIWEELGEGNVESSHVKILENFLQKLNIQVKDSDLLPETFKYLSEMESITKDNFYSALGALGPANEYLLKLEYAKVNQIYNNFKKMKNLPDAYFFDINLEADLSHSKKLFDLIESQADTIEKMDLVSKGNQKALNARKLFYNGLLENKIYG